MSKKTVNKTSSKGSNKTSSQARVTETDNGTKPEAQITKHLTNIASALGLGRGKGKKRIVETSDVNTNLGQQRTGLAMERNYMAAERTLMGWIRTALAMISFGFTIGKLGQVIHDVQVKGVLGFGSIPIRTVSIDQIAHFLVVLGTIALIGAAFQHRRRIMELRIMGLRHQISITFIIAILLAALGGFALSALILAL